MSRNLSSGSTFIFKFIFPAVWISAFGIGAVSTFMNPGDVRYNGVRGAAPAYIGYLFLVFWLVGSSVILWTCAPLKRVRLEDGALLVSNYFHEWRVPLALITDVSQNRWINIEPITIRLREEVGCGRKVSFIPAGRRRFMRGKENPEVSELRELAGLKSVVV